MARTSDNFELKIENSLRILLENQSLNDWCSKLSNKFLNETGQSKPPFSIVEYFPHRKITASHDENLPVTGKIEVIDNGFLLSVNPQKLNSSRYYNFVLAHELAHTFFYSIDYKKPVEISGLSPVSKNIEYLCNKIARYLILPSVFIMDDINKLPSVDSINFNLGCINTLLEKYYVSSFTLLTRIIVDEPLWDAIFIQFNLNKESNSWEMVSLFYPRYLNGSKFFIPNPSDSKKRSKFSKYPSAKNILANFLDNLYSDLKNEKRVYKKVNLKDFIDEPLKQIFKSNILDIEKGMHFSINKGALTINILIPIDNSVVGSL